MLNYSSLFSKIYTNKKLLILIAVVGLVILLVLVVAFPKATDDQRTFSTETKETSQETNISPTVFSHPIFKPEEIDFVGPLGELNGGYIEVQTLGGLTINIKKEIAEQRPIEVYAPTDMELISYSHTLMEPEPTADWSLYFKINDNLNLNIHHIKNASPKIVEKVGSTPKKNDSRTMDIRGPNSIKFKAGEIIGTTTGTSLAHNWNIYLQDKRIQNQFVNQKRYVNNFSASVLVNAACIFDYYGDETIKKSFYGLLGNSKAGQTDSCGNPSKDKEGTLSGLWHLQKEGLSMGDYEGDYADPFSVYMTSDKSVVIYEVGRKRYIVYPNNPTHRDPADITTSHCYRLTDDWNPNQYQGYAFFRIDSDTQMSFAYSPSGSCPTTFPANQAKTYYR